MRVTAAASYSQGYFDEKDSGGSSDKESNMGPASKKKNDEERRMHGV